MNFFNLNNVKVKLYEFNSFQIFFLSFIICLSFYVAEGILGIDRFYHPDSAHYLGTHNDSSHQLKSYINNPLIILKSSYYNITDIFNDNYYLLIFINFILYSLTNVFIFQKVFKRYFYSLNSVKLIILFYLLFLDPYRLHLASHILKETFLIFFIVMIILSNIKIIKILSIIFMESFRPNSWIYLFIFFTYSNIKKFFNLKLMFMILVLMLVTLLIIILTDQNLYEIIQTQFNNIISTMKKYHYNIMPLRAYDHVIQFKDYGFPLGFILKNVTWPIMLVSGLFMFFVSSLLFKFLGAIILLNNIFVYIVTKKTFISVGLLIILVMISVYTSSYTAMFRYSYVAIYGSVIYFFLNFNSNINTSKNYK